jgi:predicted nucleotidyltransferase
LVVDSLADTQLLLQDVVAALVRAVDPEKVILFGSRARGDAAEDSDIDLFLEVKTGRDTGRLAEQSYRAIHRLKDRPPVGIDVVVKDTAYVERFSDSVGTVVPRLTDLLHACSSHCQQAVGGIKALLVAVAPSSPEPTPSTSSSAGG